jgi:UDPglucose 6-dehydrogenase
VFKPNKYDNGKVPLLAIIDVLTKAGATVTVYDPETIPILKGQVGDKIKYAENQSEVLAVAEALIIAT